MKPLLTELWPQFCADADFVAGYAGALVERVEADRKKRIIKVVYRTVAPVAGELRTRLCASLAPLFPGFLVSLQGLFEYDRLTPQAVLDLAMELREDGMRKILKYGVACWRKKCRIMLEEGQAE